MENIAKAIQAVMKDVQGMEKNSRVGSGGSAYDGTKYSDVAERFNESMTQNGLCILPTAINETTQIDRWEEVDQWSKATPKAMKAKQSVFTKVTTKYLLLHTSGESVELSGYGHGVDPQDKGAGKATTYALKNVLLYTFLTPVGKMDDSDSKHSNDIQAPPKPLPPINTQTFDKYCDWILSATKDKKGDVITVEYLEAKHTLTDDQKQELANTTTNP
jgi:hypothetical protein